MGQQGLHRFMVATTERFCRRAREQSRFDYSSAARAWPDQRAGANFTDGGRRFALIGAS